MAAQEDYKTAGGKWTRRDFLYLSGLGAAGMALAGIPGVSLGAEKRPKYGGRLVVGERFAPPGLDPHKNQLFPEYQAYLLMYNALTIMGPLPEVGMHPDLAKSWEISSDGREYIFSLRENVKFHHGKELDSGDVKYSFERVMNPATRAPKRFAFQWVDGVNIVDKYHIKFKLKEPFGPFLTTLTIMDCPIIPAGSQPTGTKLVPGTGPFILKSYVPNETYEVRRFDQYWEIDEKTGMRLPYLNEVYVKKIVDETIRWTALRTGDVDYIQVPPFVVAVQEPKKPTPGVVLVTPPPVGCTWIFLNCSKPPFDKKEVRQALAHALNKEEILRGAMWGMGETTNNQPFVTGSRYYVPIKDREVDLRKARQLLADAGYPKGFKTEFFEYSYNKYTEPAQVAIGQLKDVGIEATMKVLDRAAWTTEMIKGNYSISLSGDSERLDPDDAYFMRLHSSEIGKNNWSRYSNKEMDELLQKGRTTWKWEDRAPVYKKVSELIREELPIIYLMKTINHVAHRDYVKGHDFGAATWFGYYGGGLKKTWLDK
jgi:peptide/nickel transport system substrate-binding protein